MARRIVDAGFPTTLWARRPASLEPLRRHRRVGRGDARPSSAPRRTSSASASSTTPASTRSCAAPSGALAAMADGSVVIVHSTVHPATCLRLQEDYPNLHVLDAPVSGGGHKAAAGELLVMVGGPAEVVDRCRPVLETFGDPVLHLGPLGAGQEAKLLNNAVFAAQLALAAEVFALAADAGPRPAGRRHDPVQRQRSQLRRRGRRRQRLRPRGPRPVRRRPAGQGRRHPRRPGRPRRHGAARRRRPSARADGRAAGDDRRRRVAVGQRAPAGARRRAPLRHARHRRRVAPPDRRRGGLEQQLGGPLPLRLEAGPHRRDLPVPPAADHQRAPVAGGPLRPRRPAVPLRGPLPPGPHDGRSHRQPLRVVRRADPAHGPRRRRRPAGPAGGGRPIERGVPARPPPPARPPRRADPPAADRRGASCCASTRPPIGSGRSSAARHVGPFELFANSLFDGLAGFLAAPASEATMRRVRDAGDVGAGRLRVL